jgi:hypothetical protein
MTTQAPKPSAPLRGPRIVYKKAEAPPAKASWIKGRGAIYGLIVAAVGVFVWAGWSIFGGYFQPTPPDPAVAQAKEVAAFLASDKFEGLSEARKDAYAQQIRQLPNDRRREIMRVEGLSSADRRKMGENLGRAFREEMMKSIRAFFQLPPDQRMAELDRRMAEGGPGGFMGGPGGPGGGPPGDRPPQANPNGTANKGGPPRGNRQPNPDLAQQYMEQRLSGSTPEDRAYMDEYRRLVSQRRQQLSAPK